MTHAIAARLPRLGNRRASIRERAGGAGQGALWLLLAGLAALPLVPLAYASLRSQPYYLPGGHWTISGYRTLLDSPAFRTAAKNTAIYALFTAGMSVAIGTSLAVLTCRTDMPGRRWLGLAVLAPIALPPLGLIVGWVTIYGPTGYITQLLHQNLGLPSWNLYSLAGMIVFGTVVATPVTYLVARAALTSSNSALEDAARSVGASSRRILRSVTIPLLRPAMANSFILVLALAVEVLGIPLILGSGRHVDLVASYLYTAWNNSSSPSPSFVSAGGVMVLGAVALLLLLRHRIVGAEQRFIITESRGGRGNVRPIELGPLRWPAAVMTVAFLVLTVVVPLLGLALMSSVTSLTTLIAPWHLFTAANWNQVLSQPALQRSIYHSLLIAFVGGAATVTVVTFAAILAHRSRFVLRSTIPPLLVYPRSVPGSILGVGFFWAFLMLGSLGSPLRTTIWGELVALCVRNITLAYMVIYPAMTRLSTDFDRAGRAVGGSWWTIARRIVIPNLKAPLIAAFVLLFVVLMSDYDPVVFLQKPGTEILGVTMLQQWQVGIVGSVAALAVLQAGVVVAALGIGGLLLRRFYTARG